MSLVENSSNTSETLFPDQSTDSSLSSDSLSNASFQTLAQKFMSAQGPDEREIERILSETRAMDLRQKREIERRKVSFFLELTIKKNKVRTTYSELTRRSNSCFNKEANQKRKSLTEVSFKISTKNSNLT